MPSGTGFTEFDPSSFARIAHRSVPIHGHRVHATAVITVLTELPFEAILETVRAGRLSGSAVLPYGLDDLSGGRSSVERFSLSATASLQAASTKSRAESAVGMVRPCTTWLRSR